MKEDTAIIVEGAEFCFVGSHTVKPIPSNDERRSQNDLLVLHVGEDLQREIDDIPSKMPNVRVLVILNNGSYDDSFRPKLQIAMPKLETLKLDDVCFQTVHLDHTLTPNITELSMQNIPDNCNLTVLLPKLQSFSMHYYGPPPDDSWMHAMLLVATKLRTFDSYKLRVSHLKFASNELELIDLHRAECLTDLIVYAPKLRSLRLQACYNLDQGRLTILETPPDDSPQLQPTANGGPPTRFVVDTTNAVISPSIAHVLRNHPRIIWDENNDDDDGGFSGNPCESMFAQMRRNGSGL